MGNVKSNVIISLLLTLSMNGCSSIDKFIEGWPTMKIQAHQSNLLEINQKCWQYLPTIYKISGAISFACAVYDLNEKTCDIYLTPGSPDAIRDHEMAHCYGGDHADGGLKEAYIHWLDIHEMPNGVYSETPPRLIVDQVDQALIWDHSSEFGPIPDGLWDDAERECSLHNQAGLDFKPAGYHPFAEDVDGLPLFAGGYYCAVK